MLDFASLSGSLMSGDVVVAEVRRGQVISCTMRAPLYIARTKDLAGWLEKRAIDRHRTNSRLLKKALRLSPADDAEVALVFNAASITDDFWYRPIGSLLQYSDVVFKANDFDTLALRGDPDGFTRAPSRTPELTNIGSFEKCWRLINGVWWMYKNEKPAEQFSELFIYHLGQALGLDMAVYELHDGFVRTKDFTEGRLNFESFAALSDDDGYQSCFHRLFDISPALAQQYLKIIWLDSICLNVDRHTENFGFLRSRQTGEILRMAPNFDNNIALISNGYPADVHRQHDRFLGLFNELMAEDGLAKESFLSLHLPVITPAMIEQCLDAVPLPVDRGYIATFILAGQTQINEDLGLADPPTPTPH